ncbi:uncharacterized protein LOC123684272 isoform X1 [Harmonia axyridis]|uniref:uncharacterized protein LOC123684272 isoform X1 n=2 Tax=Harmonia axyridis TaxID=115357 RepID=UPI001E27872B|nr:uncharacterized protein LOC123684272 isoform X1 [Harmonia axyridis]
MLLPVKKQRLSKRLNRLEKTFNSRMEKTDEMEFTDDQIKDASTFCNFYLDLIHSFNDKTKYFLSENVVLDYFGRTIKGQKNVTSYIKSNLVNVGHLFEEAKPMKEIGFRDTHVVNLPTEPKKVAMPFFSPPKSNEAKTPTKSVSQPSTSSAVKQEERRGVKKRLEGCSPAKRLKKNGGGDELGESSSGTELVECESEPLRVKYMVSEGHVEFRKPSMKKLQTECRWRRPCKLSVAYSSTSNQDCSIYLIIYEGNVKCRRNLMKEFDEAEPKD